MDRTTPWPVRVLRIVRAGVSRLGFPHRPEPATRRLGRLGEQAAARLLKRGGYQLLGTNVHVPFGEADLVCIAPDRSTIVIVEVKSRLRREQAPVKSVSIAPEASVTALKRRKLLRISRYLIRANKWQSRPSRIDVIAADFDDADGQPRLTHHINAVKG